MWKTIACVVEGCSTIEETPIPIRPDEVHPGGYFVDSADDVQRLGTLQMSGWTMFLSVEHSEPYLVTFVCPNCREAAVSADASSTPEE